MDWFSKINIIHLWFVLLFPVLLILTGIWCWRRGRKHKRWYFWPLPLVLPIILLGALAAVNYQFQYATTLGAAFNNLFPAEDESIEVVKDAMGKPQPNGLSVQVAIPATKSAVGSQDATIWLPPQYFEKKITKFPVVYLIPGTPGYYTDWSLGAGSVTTAQKSAAAGKPAIIVQPSAASNRIDDTECVDGAPGNWEKYLAEDVPDYVNGTLRTLEGAKNQAMGGLSMGGYCAQIIPLRHPTSFGFFGNFAGTTMPTYPDGMSALFGSVPDLDATVNSYTSTWVIQNKPESRTVAGQVMIGKQDNPRDIADEQRFVAAAKSLGMDVEFITFDGRHDFNFWKEAFQKWLPWALSRMGSPK